MATSSKGTSGEVPRVSFDGKDAPIRSVVVYTNNMAQIKRVVNFSANARGLHEVILVVDAVSYTHLTLPTIYSV